MIQNTSPQFQRDTATISLTSPPLLLNNSAVVLVPLLSKVFYIGGAVANLPTNSTDSSSSSSTPTPSATTNPVDSAPLCSAQVYSYSLDTKRWESEAPLPVGLCGHSATLVSINSGSAIIVVGGTTRFVTSAFLLQDVSSLLSQNIYHYDIKNRQWSEVATSGLNLNGLLRYSHTAVYDGSSSIWLYGGQQGYFSTLSDIVILTLNSQQLTSTPTLYTPQMIQGLASRMQANAVSFVNQNQNDLSQIMFVYGGMYAQKSSQAVALALENMAQLYLAVDMTHQTIATTVAFTPYSLRPTPTSTPSSSSPTLIPGSSSSSDFTLLTTITPSINSSTTTDSATSTSSSPVPSLKKRQLISSSPTPNPATIPSPTAGVSSTTTSTSNTPVITPPLQTNNQTYAIGPSSSPNVYPVNYGFASNGTVAYYFGGSFNGQANTQLWKLDAQTNGAWNWSAAHDLDDFLQSPNSPSLLYDCVYMTWQYETNISRLLLFFPYTREDKVGGMLTIDLQNSSNTRFVPANITQNLPQFSTPSTNPPPPTPVKPTTLVIAFIAVGGVIGIFMIAIAITMVVLWKRRKHQQSHNNGKGKMRALDFPNDQNGDNSGTFTGENSSSPSTASGATAVVEKVSTHEGGAWALAGIRRETSLEFSYTAHHTTDVITLPMTALARSSSIPHSSSLPVLSSAGPSSSSGSAGGIPSITGIQGSSSMNLLAQSGGGGPVVVGGFRPPARTVTQGVQRPPTPPSVVPRVTSNRNLVSPNGDHLLPSYAEVLSNVRREPGPESTNGSTHSASGGEEEPQSMIASLAVAAGVPGIREEAMAMTSHVPVGKEEIELRVGDHIGLLPDPNDSPNNSFVRGYNFNSGRTGLFPRSSIIVLPPRQAGQPDRAAAVAAALQNATADITWWRAQAAQFNAVHQVNLQNTNVSRNKSTDHIPSLIPPSSLVTAGTLSPIEASPVSGEMMIVPGVAIAARELATTNSTTTTTAAATTTTTTARNNSNNDEEEEEIVPGNLVPAEQLASNMPPPSMLQQLMMMSGSNLITAPAAATTATSSTITNTTNGATTNTNNNSNSNGVAAPLAPQTTLTSRGILPQESLTRGNQPSSFADLLATTTRAMEEIHRRNTAAAAGAGAVVSNSVNEVGVVSGVPATVVAGRGSSGNLAALLVPLAAPMQPPVALGVGAGSGVNGASSIGPVDALPVTPPAEMQRRLLGASSGASSSG